MKIEYGDLYKFVVSLGVALVIFAVLIPWLFFRESFDLLLTQAELSELTNVSQVIIQYRQNLVNIFFRVIPYLSISLLILGIICLITGLRLWWIKSQRSVDQQQQLTIKLLQRQLREDKDLINLEQQLKKALENEANTNAQFQEFQKGTEKFRQEVIKLAVDKTLELVVPWAINYTVHTLNRQGFLKSGEDLIREVQEAVVKN